MYYIHTNIHMYIGHSNVNMHTRMCVSSFDVRACGDDKLGLII